ncbi:MAG: hypothetical protein ABR577_09355 [Pyrinomonadaceae bacterium]
MLLLEGQRASLPSHVFHLENNIFRDREKDLVHAPVLLKNVAHLRRAAFTRTAARNILNGLIHL